jgi:hypothetical protein
MKPIKWCKSIMAKAMKRKHDKYERSARGRRDGSI